MIIYCNKCKETKGYFGRYPQSDKGVICRKCWQRHGRRVPLMRFDNLKALEVFADEWNEFVESESPAQRHSACCGDDGGVALSSTAPLACCGEGVV